MSRTWREIVFTADGFRLKNGQLEWRPIQERLESGAPAAEVADEFAVSPAELTLGLAAVGLGDDDGLGPPLVHADPQNPRLRGTVSNSRGGLGGLFPTIPEPRRLALVAAVSQILDFWDDSHEAAQQADDRGEGRLANVWHAIAHRREPDHFNAGYWYRRVNRRPAFPAIAAAVAPLLDDQQARALAPGGVWDPMAFLDFCRQAAPGSNREALARRLQRIEMRVLVESTLDAVIGSDRIRPNRIDS